MLSSQPLSSPLWRVMPSLDVLGAYARRPYNTTWCLHGAVALGHLTRRVFVDRLRCVRRFACYVETHWDLLSDPVTAEPEPAWPRALWLALVHAVPYLFHCRAVMLSFVWIFGRVSLAWLVPVCLCVPCLDVRHLPCTQTTLSLFGVHFSHCMLYFRPSFRQTKLSPCSCNSATVADPLSRKPLQL